MLSFSPDQRASIEITRQIVSAAPKCEGWEFYAAKPHKKWQQLFIMRGDRGADVRVDASSWDYVLRKLENGRYRVIVETTGIAAHSQRFKQTAAEILVEGELGEELALKAIEDVRVVDDLDAQYSNTRRPVSQLHEALILAMQQR
jgi:hypothetical protein